MIKLKEEKKKDDKNEKYKFYNTITFILWIF